MSNGKKKLTFSRTEEKEDENEMYKELRRRWRRGQPQCLFCLSQTNLLLVRGSPLIGGVSGGSGGYKHEYVTHMDKFWACISEIFLSLSLCSVRSKRVSESFSPIFLSLSPLTQPSFFLRAALVKLGRLFPAVQH